jgi:hypothetical protein
MKVFTYLNDGEERRMSWEGGGGGPDLGKGMLIPN